MNLFSSSLWGKLAVSTCVIALMAGQPGHAQSPREAVPHEGEIIVTAQKKAERLQDVPVPVSAISADSLISKSQARLQDYYSAIPGLAFAAGQYDGTPSIAVRGITTGDTANPAVGITVDDVPFGSSTSIGGGAAVPDLDPSDLARIEVLRGPQGTLYGAASMGGLVKYVLAEPDLTEVRGRIRAGVMGVSHSGEAGYDVSGALNIPLGERLALRVSGFGRREPGYIDNIRSGKRDVNKSEAAGGLLTLLWKPVDDFSLKFSALHQKHHMFGFPFITVDPGLGLALSDFKQDFLPNSGWVKRNYTMFSATAQARLGGIDLTSVTAYNISTNDQAQDYTGLYGSSTLVVYPTPYTINKGDPRTRKFSQELRAATSLGRFDLQIGGFYTHESTDTTTQYIPTDVLGNRLDDPINFFANYESRSPYSEWAIFGALTYHITDRFQIQVGGRRSEIHQEYSDVGTGIFIEQVLGGTSPRITPNQVSDDTAYTYLITPQFKIRPGLMVYGRFASGYRPGGINVSFVPVPGVPAEFRPDKTQNYEIGIKGDAFQRRLSFDVSLFHIDWKDIQLQVTANENTFFANGSGAKSQGVELAAQATPMTGLRLAGWVMWNNAVLTRDFPPGPAVGLKGDRLPFSSRYSGNASVDYEFSVGAATVTMGVATTYVGDRVGAFPAQVAARQRLGSYWKTDLRGGVKWDKWTVDLYVNNVADRRGLLAGGINSLNPTAFNIVQPRTAGISVGRDF